MSVRAMRFRGIMAAHFKRVVFMNGELDMFQGSFSELSPDQRKRYDALGETIESSQEVLRFFNVGPDQRVICLGCRNPDCLSTFKYCPQCGAEL
jgi:hypothetical protein